MQVERLSEVGVEGRRCVEKVESFLFLFNCPFFFSLSLSFFLSLFLSLSDSTSFND